MFIIPHKRGTDLETKLPRGQTHVKVNILLSWRTDLCFENGVLKCVRPPHDTRLLKIVMCFLKAQNIFTLAHWTPFQN